MKLTIAYLYPDLLNLYGDSGNIKALEYHFKMQKIDYTIKYLSLNDKKDFSKYDLVYIGSGTDKNLLLALDDLIKYKKDIKNYIDKNKFMLVTGNAIELFGEYIRIKSKVIKALNIMNYHIDYDDRIVKDVNINYEDYRIIGFENHLGHLVSDSNNDIINYNNFYGTYIIGPLLVRNPYLCKDFIKNLIISKDKDFKFQKDNYELEEKAYNEKKEN